MLALEITDAIIGMPHALPAELQQKAARLFKPEELAELIMGVGLFLGMSKVLINLGVEPESMPTTVIPTPGS